MSVDNENRILFTNNLQSTSYYYAETPVLNQVQYYSVESPSQEYKEISSKTLEEPSLQKDMESNYVLKESQSKNRSSKYWFLVLIPILLFAIICGIVLGLIPVYLNGK